MNPPIEAVTDRVFAAPPPACIMIVDDQPANIRVAGAALGKLGHEIIPASSGPSALRRMKLRQPDLILLDMIMPEMDGCEVCRRIRAKPEWNDIPVIFLSAADDKDFIVRALESGGVDYITKPFCHAELISRVRTQLALKSARDRLKQLAEDKDELLGILTHDLKNQLAGMKISAEVLGTRLNRAGKPDPRLSRLVENISRSSEQLLEFVKEFLANAAADHGFTIKLELLNLADAAAMAVRQYEVAARQKQLELQISLPPEGAAVLADASALDQVLDNLLSNAVKFSPPGKQIAISIVAGPSSVECRVQDQGPGFTDEDKAQMFGRYRRLSARPTGGEPSAGLGLSIIKKLVQAMNGEVECQSTPGEGSTFIIRLPAGIGTSS